MSSPAFPTITDGTGSGILSSAMVERVVYTLLRGAFTNLAASPAMVDRVFRFLTDTERTNVKALLAQRPPNIVHGYPRRGLNLPCVAIALGSEQETDEYIDDYMGDDDVDADGESATGAQAVYGSRVRTTLSIVVVGLSPDHVQYLYQLVWAIVKAMKRPLNELQVTMQALSGGDVEPRDDLSPEMAFARTISVPLDGTRTYVVDAALWADVVVQVEIAV